MFKRKGFVEKLKYDKFKKVVNLLLFLKKINLLDLQQLIFQKNYEKMLIKEVLLKKKKYN